MRLRRPVRHDALVLRLWQAARAGRLPHALCLEGPRGIGKFEAARWFAAGMLCASGPGEPCLACGPCKRVQSGGDYGNHGDLFLLDPALEGEERLRIARIAYRPDTPDVQDPERCVERFLELRPVEGGARVLLIRESQRMLAEAQNAFLKTLEEPRPGVWIVLETSAPDALLATIKSRCMRIRLDALEPSQCVAILRAEGLAEDEARELSRWSRGAPGTALFLAARGARAIRALLVDVLSGARAPAEGARELFELEGDFEGERETVRGRDRARTVLELAEDVLQDLARAAHGLDPAGLAHGDVVRALGALGAPPLERALARLAELRADVDRNLQAEALVERALLVLGEVRGILSGSLVEPERRPPSGRGVSSRIRFENSP